MGSWTRTLTRLGDNGSAETGAGRHAGLDEKVLANKHHLLAGDQALRVAAGFGLARFCPTVRLAALTEHEERYTVASEFLPADLRKTVPAHDMRLCILKRETKRTMLEAQWGTKRDLQSLGQRQHRLRGETCRVLGQWLPRLVLLVAHSAIFRMLVVRAEHSRNVGACWREEFFFFCVESCTPASRERCGYVVRVSS